ncbi:14754_t:CDS:1, partial [Entrophospora sp. SA101]
LTYSTVPCIMTVLILSTENVETIGADIYSFVIPQLHGKQLQMTP